ncbi:MAG: hypothetical protein ACM3YM_11580 [Sphingomonadales bacterium]
MALPRPASPKALLADLRAFVGDRSRHQWIAAVLAMLIPAFIIFAFIMEARATIPGEQIVYVHSWKASRTDAEIKADQKKAQAEKEALAKERQRQFKVLARQLGIE